MTPVPATGGGVDPSAPVEDLTQYACAGCRAPLHAALYVEPPAPYPVPLCPGCLQLVTSSLRAGRIDALALELMENALRRSRGVPR